VLFVGAFGYGVWRFVVDFGASQAGAHRLAPALAADSGLFGLFAAHHSLMARTWAKRRFARHLPASLERPIYVWVASALFILLCAAWQPLPGLAWRATGLPALLSLGLQALGALMLCGAVQSLDVRSFVGIGAPPGAPHRDPGPRTPAEDPRATEVWCRGPYRWVRHPIYLGTLLLMGAMPTITADRLALTLFVAAYAVLAIPWEERTLVERHGEAYAAYRRRVRWRLLPGVY